MNIPYVLLALSFFFFSVGKSSAQIFPDRIAVFDYIQVHSSAKESYLQSEQAWKKVHELRIQEGIITGWYLFKVHFATSEDAYNYVAINAYPNFEKLENPYPIELLEKEKLNISAQSFEDTTTLTQIKRKSEQCNLVYFVGTEKRPKYMVVKFMQRQGREELLNISIEKNLVDQGTQDWWAEFEVRFPRGLGLPYQFITLNSFSDFKSIDQMEAANTRRNSLYRAEIWELIDYVEKK